MKRLKLIIFAFVRAPVLFAASFVLTTFAYNIGELSFEDLALPLVATIIFAAILSAVFDFLLKDRVKGDIFSSIFVVLFFSFGGASSALTIIRPRELLLLGWLLLFLASFFVIRRVKRSPLTFAKFVLIVSVLVTLLPVFSIGRYEVSQRLYPPVESPLKLPDADAASHKNLPDIYYIVPEDYSSPAVLKEYFNYDASDFTNFLKQKGFYVPDQSISNYPKSFLSIASTLNMEYMDYLSSHKNSSDQTIVTPLIENNNVLKFLKSLGYKYYQMGSWWGPTHYNPFADENFILENQSFGGVGEFNYVLLQSTMFRPFLSRIFPKAGVVTFSDSDIRKRVIYQFDELPNVEKLPGPKFVFLHIISPHGPYVLGKNCEPVGPRETKQNSEEQNYVNQVSCMNQKLEGAISSLLENSKAKPIILLETDEGAPFLGGKLSPADNWKSANDALLAEKFPIIAAYYLPGKSTKLLYPTITPVNSFRVIFNLYFSTKLPLLPDKAYVFVDINNLYEFIDVTSRVYQK